MSIEEKIRTIEEEIKRTQYNKATQHHIGKLRAKIARLKEDAEARRGGRGPGVGYGVKKAGDATVVLVGFPSVGKSTLLNRLTNADSLVATYDFTTIRVVPGLMEYKGARIQILDIPGLIQGAASGKGRGREVLAVIKSADLVLLLLDVFNPQQLGVLLNELREVDIRLDARPPDVRIKVRERGGVRVSSTIKLTKIDEETIRGILEEYRIHNADVVVREDLEMEEFLDVVAGNRRYIPSTLVLNKVDLVDKEYIRDLQGILKRSYLPISADKGLNLEELKELIYQKLDFIKLYMKPQGGEADTKEPLIILRGARIGDVCDSLHRDFRRRFRYAQVWGTSVRFGGQHAGLEHLLADGDVITIVTKR